MKKRKSPCIERCDFSGSKGWCSGCGRTKNECQKWKSMTPYNMTILQKELKKRMLKITVEMS